MNEDDNIKTDLVKKYGSEIIRFLKNSDIQRLFMEKNEDEDKPAFSNKTIAIFLINASEEMKAKILQNISAIRKEKVTKIFQEFGPILSKFRTDESNDSIFQKYSNKAMQKQFHREYQNAKKTVLKRMLTLKHLGKISLPITIDECEKVVIDENFLNWQEEEIECFDIDDFTLSQIITYWNNILKKVYHHGILFLDKIRPKIKDSYSSYIFKMALDEYPDSEIAERAEILRKIFLTEKQRRLDIIQNSIFLLFIN
ncbi:MAG: hypothetical protein HQK79_23315 [Desulfobacterales bacterium]|nr:hypothetical protein [Desulfobacterales bacterium]